MILPPILAPHLRVVFVGTASASGRSNSAGCYYGGPGNKFYYLVHAAGLTDRRLEPEQDSEMPKFGLGLTDLVRPTPDDEFDAALLHRQLRRAHCEMVAFTSKTAANAYARAAGVSQRIDYGPAPWPVDGRRGFVLPGPSGANNGMPLPLRVAMWRDLADALR